MLYHWATQGLFLVPLRQDLNTATNYLHGYYLLLHILLKYDCLTVTFVSTVHVSSSLVDLPSRSQSDYKASRQRFLSYFNLILVTKFNYRMRLIDSGLNKKRWHPLSLIVFRISGKCIRFRKTTMSLSRFPDCQSTLEPLFGYNLCCLNFYTILYFLSLCCVYQFRQRSILLLKVERPRLEQGSSFERQFYMDTFAVREFIQNTFVATTRLIRGSRTLRF